MRPLSRTFAALAAVAAVAPALVAAPASAMPAVTLTPHGLPRGADVSIPHLDGKTVVDGAVRLKVKAPTVRLLGKSGTAYIVGTANSSGGHGRIYRITADGTRTLLAKAHPYETLLAGDAATVVTTKYTASPKSTISVYNATTGATISSRVFKGYASALDAQGDRVLVGSIDKAQLWTTTTNSVSVASSDGGYIGDLSADVVGTFTKDPYDGGCTEVRRISSGALLWRSCTEQVAAFNADATRIATIGIMSDGIGPGRVDARTIGGQHLGRYQVRAGWIGTISFETPTALLLEVNAGHKAFTARCTGAACERASDLSPAQMPKVGG